MKTIVKKIIFVILTTCLCITPLSKVIIQAKAANEITIAGVGMGYSAGQYFSTSGKACTCHNQNLCVPQTSSCTCIHVSGCAQCYAWVLWCEEKLFGMNDVGNPKSFYSLGSIATGSVTASSIKNLLYGKAKPGAHIRTKAGSASNHSMIIVSIDENGFTVAQANGSNNNEYTGWSACRIGTSTYTWESYASSTYGKRGIEFVKMPYDYNLDITTTHLPVGQVDGISTGTKQVTVAGWAYDADDLNRAVGIHVYIGSTCIGTCAANLYRPDVNSSAGHLGVGEYHGFNITCNVPQELTGTQSIKVFAIDEEGTNHPILTSSVDLTVTIPDTALPIGLVGSVETGVKKVTLTGWVYDPDDLSRAVGVHVYIGGTCIGTCSANSYRPDLNNNAGHLGVGEYHGFNITCNVPQELTGTQNISVFAIDEEGIYHPTLDSVVDLTVTIPDTTLPVGLVDGVGTETRKVTVAGWAYDSDDLNRAVGIHVYIGGTCVGTCVADLYRPDVNNNAGHLGAGEYHGFNITCNVPQELTGTQSITVFAIDEEGTNHPILESAVDLNVIIPDDTEEPTIKDLKVENITESEFEISCTAQDNSSIKNVQFAVWTHPEQDDLIQDWRTNSSCSGVKNGDVYTYTVKRSEHNNESGPYIVHIYAYDEYGNVASIEYPSAIYMLETYEVNYNANGGEGAPSSQIKTENSELILSDIVPSKTGYTFLGWASSETATSVQYLPGDSYVENSAVTLYAVWKPNEYTVEYDANGGTNAPKNQTKLADMYLQLSEQKPEKAYKVTYNANGGVIESETKEVFCTFNGWNTKETGDGIIYKPEEIYTENANLTLYAQWENPKIGELENPTYQGYDFEGWYTSQEGGDKISADTIVEENIMIYAHWTLHKHTWDEGIITIQPTCIEKGNTKYTCKTCGEQKNEEIDAKGHSFGEWIVIESSVCGVSGTEQRVCSVCNFIETKGLVAADHEWEDKYTVDKEATCTETGSQSIHCSKCDAVKDSKTIEATGHSFTNYESDGNATCMEDGTKTAVCDWCIETNTIKDEASATGHSFTNYESDGNATCTEDGTKTAICDWCSKTNTIKDEGSKTGHNYEEWITVKSATCVEGGSEQRKCSECDITETRDKNPLGHEWESKVTIDKEPTCIETGQQSTHCSRCDEVKDSSIIEATGHSFTVYVSNQNATCTKDGTKTAVCDKCTEMETVIDKGSAKGHEWESEATVDKEATCTANGSQSIHCSNCNEVKDRSTIEATGHDYDEWEIVITPTYTSSGIKKQTCKVCGNAETQEIEKYVVESMTLSSTSKTTEVGDAISLKLTCTPVEPSVGDVLWNSSNEAVATVDSRGNVSVIGEGTTTITASIGDTSVSCQIIVEKKDEHIHSYSSWEKYNDDQHYSICECGDTKYANHTWNDGKVTLDASCIEDGAKTYTCIICGATKTELIKATGNHVYGEWTVVKESTYTDTGLEKRVCDNCGDEETREIDKLVEDKEWPFTDVSENDWYYTYAKYVYENGIMSGTSAATFAPSMNLSRAQFATILWRINGSPEVKYSAVFTDVPENEWYTKAVIWAQQEEIVLGVGDGTRFAPTDEITREQMALMMYRYANKMGYSISESAELSTFPDGKNVSSWAEKEMKWAVSVGLITGTGKGELAPKNCVDRAQCATIITRFVKKYSVN